MSKGRTLESQEHVPYLCVMMCLLTVYVLLLMCFASNSEKVASFSVKKVGKLLVAEMRFRTLCESILRKML